jgi:HD-GYP domain-containing protein (c-di-GMP phosphodiesterase class II)
MAIKTGEPVAMRDIAGDPRYAPWREQALQGGYASSIAVPLKDEGETIGALNVCSSRKDAFGDEETTFLSEVAGDIAVAVRTWRLEGSLRRAVQRIQQLFRKTIEAIAMLAETRDPYTAGHQKRVALLACAIAKEMGFLEDRLMGLRMAAAIHDIGKLHVPVEILVKPGRLRDTEFRLIKCHPQVAYDTLKGIEFPWPVAEIIYQHHERLDGSGYPQGLTGDKMCLEAKILAVADAVEAMSSHRPYRPALGIEKALATLSLERAIRYDAAIVDICLRLFQTGAFQFKDEEEQTSASDQRR